MLGWFRKSEEQQLLKAIDQIGFRVTHVYDPKHDSPSFSYTTGFPDLLGQPEVILFGLPMDMMTMMLGELSDLCRDGGLRMADGLQVAGLLQNHVCTLRAVKRENIVGDYFHFAMWYQKRQAGTDMTEAFQLVWPGAKTGLFPWEAGCTDEVRALQPALYEAAAA